VILDFDRIRAAHERIRPYIKRTPVLTSERLDQASGAHLFFKCENFQKIGAFKARGATFSGTFPAVSQPNVGIEKVGNNVMRFFGAESGNRLVAQDINGEPAVVAFSNGDVVAVLALSVKDHLITRIYVISDQRKLAQVKRVLEPRQ